MTVFTARRRAEEFNSLVEGTTRAATPAHLAPYLELVSLLREVPAPAPRPEFSAALREELLDAADALLVPSDEARRLALPSRSRASERRLAAAVGAVAIVGASTSLAVAAQSALPGDLLYPLKRAMESAETGIRTDDTARATSLLSNATRRLDEATELSRTGDLGEAPHVADTLSDFADQASEASSLVLDDYAETGDQQSVQALRDFTAASMDTLTRLEGLLPEEARGELQHAARVLAEIDAAVERVCPTCRGGIDQIPAVLLAAGEQSGDAGPVVVPGEVLPDLAASTSGKGGNQQGDKQGKQGDTGTADQGLTDTLSGLTGATTGSDSGGKTEDGGKKGPLEDLTDELTGKGDQPASNDGVTGPLEDTVDGVVNDVDEILPDLP